MQAMRGGVLGGEVPREKEMPTLSSIPTKKSNGQSLNP